MSCNIRACNGSARSSCSIFSRWVTWYSRGLNPAQIDMAILTNLLFWQGAGQYWNTSKLFVNHNALDQLTNHNTFHFSEGGPSSNQELMEPFVPGWGERYCNNVNYVKNNAIFEPPSLRACSSTPPKQNQDFVKEHNRTPLISTKIEVH